MAKSERHWTKHAREIAAEIAGLRARDRAARIREEAEALGVKANTLRRYLAASGFLDRIGVTESEQVRIPLGPLEVVMRLWPRDQAVAARALRLIQAERMTYREVLDLEKRLHTVLAAPVQPGLKEPDGGDVLRSRIVAALADRRRQDLTEVDQVGAPSFDIVQVHRLYRSGEYTVAYLRETSAYDRPMIRGVVAFFQQILLAATIFDEVLVDVHYVETAKFYEKFIASIKIKVRDRIGILPGKLRTFKPAENDSDLMM